MSKYHVALSHSSSCTLYHLSKSLYCSVECILWHTSRRRRNTDTHTHNSYTYTHTHVHINSSSTKYSMDSVLCVASRYIYETSSTQGPQFSSSIWKERLFLSKQLNKRSDQGQNFQCMIKTTFCLFHTKCNNLLDFFKIYSPNLVG